MDRALESSVSANVMRRRGVSNDLRDRGDEWPLLNVVSGLSVVVATVVDEVSMVFGSAAAPLRLALFLWCCYRSRYGLAAAETRCVAARRCERVESLRNCSIAQQCGCPASLAKLCCFKIDRHARHTRLKARAGQELPCAFSHPLSGCLYPSMLLCCPSPQPYSSFHCF